MRSWRSLFVAFLVAREAAGSCGGLTGLEAWLCDTKFFVNDIEIDQPGTISVQLSIKKLTCTGAKLGKLTTIPNPESSLSPTFSLGLTDVAVTCNSPEVVLTKPFKKTVALEIDISGVSLQTTLVLAVGTDGLPYASSLTKTDFKIGGLKLSTTPKIPFLSSLVDIFKGEIATQVKKVGSGSRPVAVEADQGVYQLLAWHPVSSPHNICLFRALTSQSAMAGHHPTRRPRPHCCAR